MQIPVVSRRVYELTRDTLEARVATLIEERDYWRTRAERLTDAALARAHAIHEPTMVDRPNPAHETVAGLITQALSITEIDSRQTPKKGS